MSLNVPPPDKEPIEHAKRAVSHVLKRIRDDANVGYYLGLGTQTFHELVQAAAALFGEPVEKVQANFTPRGREEDLNPAAADVREAVAELQEAIAHFVERGSYVDDLLAALNQLRELVHLPVLRQDGKQLVESEVES
jgi:hypothetical protein